MKPKASLITLTLNKKQMVSDLDASLNVHCTQTPFEWLVVDNGDDGTCELPGINFLRNNRNRGNFSIQNNLAAQYAQGDVLIFLNNDMIARSDFVTDAYTILSNCPQVGIVGACLYYPDDTLQHAGVSIQQNLFPANLGEIAIRKGRLDPKKVHPSFWQAEIRQFIAVTGACMAIRREDFFRLGGFHEEFHWNFEDVDLCFRMQAEMKKICVVSPGMVLTHLESQTGPPRDVDTPLMLLQGRWRGIIRSDFARFGFQDPAETLPSPQSSGKLRLASP